MFNALEIWPRKWSISIQHRVSLVNRFVVIITAFVGYARPSRTDLLASSRVEGADDFEILTVSLIAYILLKAFNTRIHTLEELPSSPTRKV
jgi:hypothetical protein